MIPLLDADDEFPPVEYALEDPNGLLAAGGSLSVESLIAAYRRGIVPWFSEGDPILWWCPDPRMVLPTSAVRISRSLRRRLKRTDYRVTMDREFGAVLEGCAAPRRDDAGTWLVPGMITAYEQLHAAGVAHSIEVWIDDALAGGLYGVALGRMFFGESMFSRATDASKIALVALAVQLVRWDFPVIDCQMQTAHLVSLGAQDLSRSRFVRLVQRLVNAPGVAAPWTLDDDVSVILARGGPAAPESADAAAADRPPDRG
jgi:leucyl/phenylalanyl-tRNA--protein transferase